MGNEDLSKAEEFVLLMRMHYTSTLAVSSEKSSTCGQKLQKLCKHNAGRRLSINQEHQGEHLSKRYQDDDIQAFLEEATVLDPRFKSKMDRDDIWVRVRASAVAANTDAVEKLSEPRETQGRGWRRRRGGLHATCKAEKEDSPSRNHCQCCQLQLRSISGSQRPPPLLKGCFPMLDTPKSRKISYPS
ncbi:uncharacterized protein LOC123960526 isoform X2 [Micropterus dolomieu]|nr:uncharacterized protein LOC123960526 isoform X2 [Micropterus dolomieu]